MLFAIVARPFHTACATARLDIYVFNVGQADPQLIVFPSGYSILVDAGETSTRLMNCKAIAERVNSIIGKPYVDVGVVTHLHLDHVGYAGKNGFFLMEKAGISFGKLVDRNSGVLKTPGEVQRARGHQLERRLDDGLDGDPVGLLRGELGRLEQGVRGAGDCKAVPADHHAA